jgi:hypothetical protein
MPWNDVGYRAYREALEAQRPRVVEPDENFGGKYEKPEGWTFVESKVRRQAVIYVYHHGTHQAFYAGDVAVHILELLDDADEEETQELLSNHEELALDAKNS